MAHILSIAVRDSVYDNKYIYVEDFSQWDEMLEIKYRRLQVLAPYADEYIIVPFPMNQSMALTSINMNLSKSLQDLPDGFYNIHYSVSPNDRVFCELGYYRVARLMNNVLTKMSSIYQASDSIDNCGNIEVDKQEILLMHVWASLKGAQAVGKDPNASKKADDLYKIAQRQYDKLFDVNCKNC